MKFTQPFPRPTKDKIVLELRKRLLKACLAPAIMAQLMEKGLLSPKNIQSVFKKNFNIQLSAGTLYPVLDRLEREGKIKRLPNRSKRLYLLTTKGEETLRFLEQNASDWNRIAVELILNDQKTGI